MEEKIYTVELTETQMKVIERACDALGRLHMGQYDTPVMDCWERNPYVRALYEKDKQEYFLRRETLHKLCDMACNTSHHLGENGSYGITSKDISTDAHIAYEIETDIRYFLWQQRSDADREATKHTVLSSPGLKLTRQPRLPIALKEPETAISNEQRARQALRKRHQRNLAKEIAQHDAEQKVDEGQ